MGEVMKRESFIPPQGMSEKEFLTIVANDLVDMVVLKEVDFTYVPSVRDFIVKYSKSRHRKGRK
jgi:hypothetical protein